MLFLTRSEYDDRLARGWEERNCHAPSPERVRFAEAIIEEIREAFRDVKLGTGVGLFEGQAIDEYATDWDRGLTRQKDEKEDWTRIETMHLNACYSSLSFFDAEGMRFHLPAFLVCELKGELEWCLAHHINDLDSSRFMPLNEMQKKIVARFLEFAAVDLDYEHSRSQILRTLEIYRAERQ